MTSLYQLRVILDWDWDNKKKIQEPVPILHWFLFKMDIQADSLSERCYVYDSILEEYVLHKNESNIFSFNNMTDWVSIEEIIEEIHKNSLEDQFLEFLIKEL